jgi:murein DD-endopeptidase MepM/ murein hydrolase activator NlpD
MLKVAAALSSLAVGGVATWTLLLAPPRHSAALCIGGAQARVKLDAHQEANAAAITTEIAKAGLSPEKTRRAEVDAMAAALQESNLHDLPYGDRDSVGLFQQRPSQGWGTIQEILDPSYATAMFLDHLRAIPGWQSMPVGQAVQGVQRSADSTGSSYQGRAAEAESIVQELVGTSCAAAATAAQSGGPSSLLCPVPHPVLTQPFGPTTVQGEPVINGRPFHTGMDLAVPGGTPIAAAAGGVVTFAGAETNGAGQVVGYGNYVAIRDALGHTEIYGHMERILTLQGLTVQAGQEIGLVGSTGFSSGPHVHFEVRAGGMAIDPAPDLRCQV